MNRKKKSRTECLYYAMYLSLYKLEATIHFQKVEVCKDNTHGWPVNLNIKRKWQCMLLYTAAPTSPA